MAKGDIATFPFLHSGLFIVNGKRSLPGPRFCRTCPQTTQDKGVCITITFSSASDAGPLDRQIHKPSGGESLIGDCAGQILEVDGNLDLAHHGSCAALIIKC